MAAVIVPLLLATVAPASASPPSNDEITNATVITSLPWRDDADLSQATWNYSTDSSQCSYWFNGYQSVWYSFTPASDEQVAFDPGTSNTQVAIDVFTGSPDALTFVGCGTGSPTPGFNPGFVLNAVADTQYWIMASSMCCATIPTLGLSVYRPEPAQASITVDAGTVDRGGNVTITGTLTCTGVVPNGVRIVGDVRQSVGRQASVSGGFDTTVPCDGTRPWTAIAQPAAGKFVGGPATVNITMVLCNILGCATPGSTTVVTFHG